MQPISPITRIWCLSPCFLETAQPRCVTNYILLRPQFTVRQPQLTFQKHQTLVPTLTILKLDLQLVSMSPPSSAFLLLLFFLCWLLPLILGTFGFPQNSTLASHFILSAQSLNLPNGSKCHLWDYNFHMHDFTQSHISKHLFLSKPFICLLPYTISTQHVHHWPSCNYLANPADPWDASSPAASSRSFLWSVGPHMLPVSCTFPVTVSTCL